MDRKSALVLLACGALFALWAYLTPRLYPPRPISRNTNAPIGVTNATTTIGTNAPIPVESATKPFASPAPGAPEELLVLTNDVARYTFTSHGGGLKLVELLKYPETVSCGGKQNAATNRMATLNSQARQPVLALAGSEALTGDGVFKIGRFSGVWPDGTNNKTRPVQGVRAEKLLGTNLYLVKEFELASNYLVNMRTRFENRASHALALPAQQWVAGTATPMNAQDDQTSVGLQWFDGGDSTKRDRTYFDNKTLGCFPGTPISDYSAQGPPVVWAAAYNQFFFMALMPNAPGSALTATRFFLPPPSREEIVADSRTLTNQFAIQVNLHHPATNLDAGQSLEREFLLYAGPKEYRVIERIAADEKNKLDDVMGYGGFFGFFSRFLLLSMNGLNALGLGYGLAIIAITVIIKLLFWPLTQASTRSMKRLQALQPQMKAIQEKYKDDPAKMNKKVMEFMKENKVSPLGGCLPLLLQIPVFIGFFQMVQSAIELRGARFLWACDLSKSDTIFVIPGIDFNVNPLPLLMGATMFWQAQLTPLSPGMDPAQQKIMKYFPMIFLVILYNYSAGLTLYWTVQNLLSIAQMKLTKATEAKTAASAKTAPAKPASIATIPKKKR
jgi:YidC/Oxa1 family membrane protein insertase